ncbi:MAG: sigma-70 family RNA polymerase sigma factor [Planctomycetales bacterium]|nr:sigma-70 family RNA polymerase sigma factor [Planctomycetales bacterium]
MLKTTPRAKVPDEEGVGKLTLRSLFACEEAALLRYAHSLVHRRAVAEDIVQEVFLQLHARWDEVETPKAWLYRSVRNKAFNYIRDHKMEVLNSDEQSGLPGSVQTETAEDHIQRREAAVALRQLVEQLDETDRQLVKLKYFQGLKYRDISEHTGLSVSNVGYRLHHILKQLAGKLRPLGIDGES